MPSCPRPSTTLRAAEAVARSRAILDRRCARRLVARAGRDERMVPIEQKDQAEESASKTPQNHPLDPAKRPNILARIRCHLVGSSLKPPSHNAYSSSLGINPCARAVDQSAFIVLG